MTVKDVEKVVEYIASQAGDDEVQHAREDRLHLDVLKAIAAGARNPRALAKVAIKTDALEFERWCV